MPLLPPAAFSPDGYIISQDHTGTIPYGCLPSSTNGCGWIAAYNFFLATGRHFPPDAVSRALAAGSPFGCYLGTSPQRLWRFLGRMGYPLRFAKGPVGALGLAGGAKAGILYYLHGREPHFVAFAAAGGRHFRFFNAVDGLARHTDTLEGFIARFCVLSILRLAVTP